MRTERPVVQALALGLLRDTPEARSVQAAGDIVAIMGVLAGGILGTGAVIALLSGKPLLAAVFVGILGIVLPTAWWLCRIARGLLHILVLNQTILELLMVQLGLRDLPEGHPMEPDE